MTANRIFVYNQGNMEQEDSAMATQTQPQHITDMTVSDLEMMISQEVRRQLETRQSSTRRDPEKLKAARRHIKEYRWTLPPGSPSVAELVRKERDR